MGSKSESSSGVNLPSGKELTDLIYGGSRNELLGYSSGYNSLDQLNQLTNAGPGTQAVKDSMTASNDLSALLKQMAQTSGLPTQGDINTSNAFSGNMFASRQTELNQMFQDQNTEAERLSARLGRPVNDPVLQAKLRTGFMRQQDSLNAEKQGYASQMALQLPGQRLNFTSMNNDLQGGLAAQAFRNRAAILEAGQNLMNNERNFRLNTASRWGEQSSGGGLGGAISGALGGSMIGANVANMFSGGGASISNSLGGGGGGGNYGLGVNMSMPTISNPYSAASAPVASPFGSPSMGKRISMFEPGR